MQSDEYLVNNKLSVPPANYNRQGVLTFAGTSVFSYIGTKKRVIFILLIGESLTKVIVLSLQYSTAFQNSVANH